MTGTVHVSAVRGPVIDFTCEGDLPAMETAVVIDPGGANVTCEVQAHLDTQHFRAIALQPTQGLSRLMNARLTGAPITVPVGDEVFGRLLNVVGDIGDNGPPSARGHAAPIDPPACAAASEGADQRRGEAFSTGIKVLDLLTPLAQGGKAALFGGAGRGQDRAGHRTDPRHGRRIRRRVGLCWRRRAVPRGA
jgi:F-type H+-transporting ATPase subunit beta